MRSSFGRRFRIVTFLVVVLAGVAAFSAAAKPPGTNGMLTFARFNPALSDTQAYVVNPDGTGERLIQGPTDTGEFPRWFPDGAHIATCCPLPGGGSWIIDQGAELAFGGLDGSLSSAMMSGSGY